MIRGGNMWFRPAFSIWFVFAQSFFKFHKNGDIRKLKAWSFRLLKNDFCRLYLSLVSLINEYDYRQYLLMHPKVTHKSNSRGTGPSAMVTGNRGGRGDWLSCRCVPLPFAAKPFLFMFATPLPFKCFYPFSYCRSPSWSIAGESLPGGHVNTTRLKARF